MLPVIAACKPARTLTLVGLSVAVWKLNLHAPILLGHVGGGSSGSTKVTVEPDGVNRLKDSISWGTPDMGQFVTRMLRA